MHRLGRHRQALVSYGTRFNSTSPATTATSEPALPRNKRHGITLRWGTVVIPSRDEVLNMPKAQSYSPDLSYLEKAPQSSLAGRLAKPKFQQPKDISAITEKRRAQRLAREQKTAKLSKPELTSDTKTPKKQPPDIAAITQRRIEKRLAREAKNAEYINKTIRTVQENADKLPSLDSLFDSPGPLPLAQSPEHPSAERSDDQLSPSALKRREERRLREKNSTRDRRSPTKKNRVRPGSITSNNMTVKEESFDSVNSTVLETASPAVRAPEFNGPEPISEAIDAFNHNFVVVQPAHQPSDHGQHSVKVSESFSYRPSPNLIDSFAGGDYSKYTSLSSASNSTSPKALTVLKTAELALSHQRDYIIPQRKHAIGIVKMLVGGDSVQVAKERQATA